MNAGLLPVTGLPLPFVSLGGTAIMVQFLGIGLAESVALTRRLLRAWSRTPSSFGPSRPSTTGALQPRACGIRLADPVPRSA